MPSYAPPSEAPPPAYNPIDPNMGSRPRPASNGSYPPAGSAGYPSSSGGCGPVTSSPPIGAAAAHPPPSRYPPAGAGYPPPGPGYPPPSSSPGYPPAPGGGYPAGGYPPMGGSGPAPVRINSGVADTARRHSQRMSAGGGRYTEDPLDLLKTFDTVLIVDDSGSMQLAPEAGGPTRWEEARDALAGLVSLVKDKDPDGVDVHFLNSPRNLLSCTDPAAVRALFESVTPDGATPTGAKIEELMMEYLDAIEFAKQSKATGRPLPETFVEPRKRNYLILTDGAATDDLEDVIVSIARRLDQSHFPLSQLGFSFVQVGDDAEAAEFLQELDDTVSASQGVRDIVDTTPYRGMSLSYDLIVKALLGGINRRFDRRANAE